MIRDNGADHLTTRQAAQRANVSERTIGKWVAGGKVGTHDGPGGRRIDRASLDGFLADRVRKAGGTGADLVPPAGPDLGAEVLAELRALRLEVAELRAELGPRRLPPPPVVRPWWRRWFRQWTEGRP